MSKHKDPIGIVEKLYSDDCLAVSDSKGTRNLQIDDFIYLDDEIISGSVQVVNKPDSGLDYSFFDLEENDEVITVLNICGIEVPKEVLSGLFSNWIHNNDGSSRNN